MTIHRKLRKTFSLSKESITLLEGIRKERRADSASSALEEILLEVKEHRERQKSSESITAYYDSLSPDGVSEAADWGRFADTQFPTE